MRIFYHNACYIQFHIQRKSSLTARVPLIINRIQYCRCKHIINLNEFELSIKCKGATINLPLEDRKL